MNILPGRKSKMSAAIVEWSRQAEKGTMGRERRIKVRGTICLDPTFRREMLMGCSGYVDPRSPLVASGPVEARTVVLRIRSEELIAEQERWISNNCNSISESRLLQMGMVPSQLDWVRRERRAISSLGVACPIKASVDDILRPGNSFGPSTSLFAYGSQAVLCRLPRDLAKLLEPGVEAGIRPIEWAAGEVLYGGTVQNLRRAGEHQQDIILDFTGKVPAFPFSTPFEVYLRPPGLSEDIDVPQLPSISSETSATARFQLPPRGVHRASAVLVQEGEARRRREAERSARPTRKAVLPLPPLASFKPPRKSARAKQTPDIRLDKREWLNAKIRTVAVGERSLPPMTIRTTATVGSSPTIGTTSRSAKPVEINLSGGSAGDERLALRLTLTRAEWASLSRTAIRVELECEGCPPVVIEGAPILLGDADHGDRVRIAVPLLMGMADLGPSPTKSAAISNVEPAQSAVAVPTNALLLAADSKAEVLVHMGEGALKRVVVVTGAESAGVTAVRSGLSIGEQVVFDAAAALETMYLAKALSKGRDRARLSKT